MSFFTRIALSLHLPPYCSVKRLVRVAYKPGTVKELSSYAAAVVVHANVIASKTERILQRRLSHYQAQLLRTQIDEV